MAWHHEPVAPWQTLEWLEQMRLQLRPNAFLRLIENRWVSSESSFVDMDWWDACTDPALSPVVRDSRLPVWCGVDASVKRDSTAIVAATWDDDAKRVRLVWHRIFQPSPKDPLDFEVAIEGTLVELVKRFDVREIRFDPYQLIAVSQRLTAQGLPMLEFHQSVPNLTEASTNLFELIKGRNLVVYPDADIRLSISRAVAVETSRGWRIAKEKVSHKIDVVVALAQAALGAAKAQQLEPPALEFIRAEVARARAAEGATVEQLAMEFGVSIERMGGWLSDETRNAMVDSYDEECRRIERRDVCAACGRIVVGVGTDALGRRYHRVCWTG
jgi:hypothetical protein